jgi:hypothetical protein
MREVSMIKITNRATDISIKVELDIMDACRVLVNIWGILTVLNEKANVETTMITTGSKMAEIVISRELPMPPKELPASSPPNAIINLAITIKYRNSITLPIPKSISGIKVSGMQSDAASRKIIFI